MPYSSTKSVYLSVRQYLTSRPDVGSFKALLNLVLEPANPFDSQEARSPRRWFVLFSLISGLGFGCFAYFNLGQ